MLSKVNLRRNDCHLCGKNNLELVIPVTPTPPADAYVSAEHLNETQQTYPLDVFFCHNCSLVQLRDAVCPEAIYLEYIYETARSPGLTEHYRRYADEVLNQLDIPDKSLVIDIGCNDGTLLKFFKARGMSVLGIDPAHKVTQRVTESGIEILPEFFTAELAGKVKDEYGQAAIITANNTIANIDDLSDVIKGIYSLLSPDGVFIFETGYLVDLVQKSVFDNIYHEHLCYFSVKPLELFFRSHGMELIDVKRVPTKGGSIRVVVQLAGGRRKLSSSVTEMITLEESFGFGRPETFKAFAEKIDSVKNQLLNLLNGFKAEGKRIAGYGASHSVTTMIYHFGLSSLLNFLVDDNSVKQNLFSPGYHIPVLHPQAIYDRKPDYMVILPWRFSEQIIKKHQAYLKQGGHFIVPLPEVKVI